MSVTPIAVEDLRGGEATPFGVVAHITCESDGVDVTFEGVAGEEAPCSHFDYRETLDVEIVDREPDSYAAALNGGMYGGGSL